MGTFFIGAIIVVGILLYRPGPAKPTSTVGATPAIINGKGEQIIEITAHGGYSPRLITAKAGIPTTIRVTTTETYDCSVSLVIPKLNYRNFLSPSGTEEIKIPAEKAQGTISGLCSMGMYSFKIVFES